MNHLKLVANQKALVRRYQAGVSAKWGEDALEVFMVAPYACGFGMVTDCRGERVSVAPV